MNKKGLIIVATIILIGIVGLLVWKGSAKNKGEETIKIGAILPLTGDQSSYATQLKKGMDLAVELYNQNSEKKIEILFEDDHGDAKNAVSAYRKLVDVNNTQLIIGGMFSASTLAIAPAAEKDGKVLLSPTASAIDITEAGDYVFRIYPSDVFDGVFLANFAFDNLEAKNIAIIYEQISSVSAISKKFKEIYSSKGGNIIYESGYTSDITDFTSMLTKLKQAKPDLVFIPGNIVPIANLLNQAKNMGIDSKFMTISTAYDPKIIELSKSAAEGLLFSAPMFDPKGTSPEMQEFYQQYRNKYGEDPDILGGYGYDVVNIAIKAMSNGYVADNIKNALYQISNYPGVTGNTTFDRNGDVVKELKMMIVKNGEFVQYQ